MTAPRAGATSATDISRAERDKQQEEVKKFIGELRRLIPRESRDGKGDSPHEASYKRAKLAALRRGLGKAPGEAVEMLPVIVPILPDKLSYEQERMYYLVASLFALYRPEQGAAPGFNFGESYRRLANATGSDSVEHRFLALLDAPRSALPNHLRHAIGQMATSRTPIPINWRRLLWDVLRWDAPSRSVQRQWARGFYTPTGETTSGGAQRAR